MKTITVSIDEEVYLRARLVAAQRGTSVSALVHAFLEGIGSGENHAQRLREAERALRARIGNFHAGDRLQREIVHERDNS